MHGELRADYGVDVVNKNELVDRNIDYLALGHYHTFTSGRLDDRGKWCYCGCLDGRGFDECGDKGFVEISVEAGKLTHRFVKNSIRKVIEVPVNMTGAVSFFEQKERISEALCGVSEDSMVRVRAEGSLRPREEKFFDQIARELSEKYFVFEIKDRTEILADRADYEGDLSLKGEFIRLVKLVRSGNVLTEQSMSPLAAEECTGRAAVIRAVNDAYSQYLNVAAELGTPALMFYLGGLFCAAIGWVRTAPESPAAAICGAGVLGYCVQAFFGISSVVSAPFFWLMLGMLVSCFKKNETILSSLTRVKRRKQT
jgi:hypothetical protein